MRLGGHVAVLLVLSLGSARAARSQPLPRESVPGPLRDWISWALAGAEERLCPVIGDSAVCLWPGRLTLVGTEQGARFSFEVWADRALDVPLPGGERLWPQDVRLDGRPAPVLAAQGVPAVRIGRGAHRLEGRFVWERLPDSLPVPPAVGLVDLTAAGARVAFPRREESGLLVLRQAGAAQGGENLALKVFRRIEDGIPLWVETRIVFDVSGRAREVGLGGALLPDTVPVAVTGELPARLDADGRLRVQVRAGSFTVKVLARLSGRPERLAAVKASPPWPIQEVWVFTANERLRQVELAGAPPIDPSRTDLPDEWRSLPAFVIEPGGSLVLKELQRGEPLVAPDQVRLTRTLWLDEDGSGFSVRDAMAGQLLRTTRLELSPPGELGRVALGGAGQLVTLDPRSGAAGVEVRSEQVRLEADSRLPRRLSLPAVGWSLSVESLAGELRVSPGWRLFAATGVDQARGSWVATWNLWSFFFVILTTLAALRLLGRAAGLVTLATLVLLHDEPGAPRLLWLFLLGALALRRAAREGRLATVARAAWFAGLLILAFSLVPFAVDQVRSGLFPQVGRAFGIAGGVLDGRVAAPAAPPAAAPAEAARYVQEAEDKIAAAKLEAGKVPARAARLEANVLYERARQKAHQLDPYAMIQSGAGVPTWGWASYPLVWSGPVAKDQSLRLFLLGPRLNLLLALLRVALATLLALWLAASAFPALAVRLRWPPAAPTAMLLATLLTLAGPASAEEAPPRGGLLPSDELLQALRERLTRRPACAPDCVTTASLALAVEGSELRLVAEVHAGGATAWPIPGPAGSWVPRSVRLDGRAAEGGLARREDGFLHLRVEPGVHRVELAGPLPPRDSLTLQFGEAPRRASARAAGWQVDGIREDGSADASVQLSRRLATAASGRPSAGTYQPWLEITRALNIGVSWTVETLVRRVSPVGDPLVVKVPLLKGMLVTDGERQVKDGEVLAMFGRDETETSWGATLEPAEGESVTLQAPEGRPWSEVWIVNCGPVWQCEATGLPPVRRFEGGQLSPEFRPWPGERLTLTFRRPKGAPGQTVTIDRARLEVAPGARLEDAALTLDVRATRPGPLTLTLPAGAEIQELKVKGSSRPVRPEGTKLTVSLDAGPQPVRVAWRRTDGLSPLHRVAPVRLGQGAVNTTVSLKLPQGRWLLLTGGPSWGPAVLFWGYLLLVLLGAWALSRLPRSPLTLAEWLLLALGLTQIPLLGAFIVSGWFFAVAWRRERQLEKPAHHDLAQIGLVLWTLLAAGWLYAAVHRGLLLGPDMQVAGAGSSHTVLEWYRDRTTHELPRPWVLSLSLWWYRLLMLAWSLWLALRLTRWTPWAWQGFTSGGIWKRLRKPPAASPAGL